MKPRHRILQLFLILSVALPIILLAIACSILFNSTYSEFIQKIAVAIDKPDWIDFLKSVYSGKSFQISKIVALSLLIVIVLLLIPVWKRKEKITANFASFISDVKSNLFSVVSRLKSYPSIDRILILLLLGLLAARSFWLMFEIPMQYDEMWTSNYFIDRSIWKSFILPGNNHILYSFVASIFLYLPIDRDIAIRLPAMISALAFVFVFWVMTRRYFNNASAMISTVFVSSSVMVTMFSVLARSYSFVLLFSVLSIWIFFKMKESANEKCWRTYFVIVLLFGYLSNPLFFFTHCFLLLVTITDSIQTNSWLLFRSFFKVSLKAVPILLVFYLPDILTNHAAEIARYGFPDIYQRSFLLIKVTVVFLGLWQMGYEWGSVILFPIVLITAWLNRKHSPADFFTRSSVVALGMLLLFSFIQAKPLFDHVVIFFTISVGISVAGLCFYFSSKKFSVNKWVVVIVAVIVFLFNSYFVYRGEFLRWSRQMDITAHDISKALIEKNIKKIYLQYGYLKPAIEYYSRKAGIHPDIEMGAEKSLDYRQFNADGVYEAIIVEKDFVLPGITSRYQKTINYQLVDIWLPK